jgi:hypothetical protein
LHARQPALKASRRGSARAGFPPNCTATHCSRDAANQGAGSRPDGST